MKNMIKYSNTHKNALLATLSASEGGLYLLNNVQLELRLTGEELRRMENESGIPLSNEQIKKLEACTKATRRIEKILLHARKVPARKPAYQPLYEIH